MRAERYVARCGHCGAAYSARSWYWLDALGIECSAETRASGATAVEVRRCAVPGCCHTLARMSEVSMALARVKGRASNDVE